MTDRSYPEVSHNPDFPAILISGSPAYQTEVVRILDHIRAHSRIGAFIIDSILLNADRNEGLRIHTRRHRPHDQRTAATTSRITGAPRGNAADPMAHPRGGAAPTIAFDPFEWEGLGARLPDARDEVLMHELVHCYMVQRGISSGQRLAGSGPLGWLGSSDDVYAVLVTNVYLSECGRSGLIHQRRDPRRAPFDRRNSQSIAVDPQFRPYFTSLARHAPALDHALHRIKTEFNPWILHPEQPIDIYDL
ncbi:hypothetical protein [Bradyrhizobium prioriisuperbiae]|uniref:hypothetical protein n=1 Tax=Bradyrhizobium prioriisuperbiae TaxID=2854389 RepID=UPI0028E47388|nr:hypothetical protein [Bradyrhizobium prioritasuperba]